MKYEVNQRVRKVGGSYQANGTVVAAFTTTAGLERYVVELDVPAGLLHIFNEKNLCDLEYNSASS